MFSLSSLLPCQSCLSRFSRDGLLTLLYDDCGSVVPLSIAGAHRFFDTLSDFLGIIGYWCGAFAIILAIEHFIFRHGNAAEYDVSAWNRPRELPYGVAAFLTLAISFGIAVPAMDQVWYVGPIAETTGDLGFELAFLAALLVYPPLRWLEIRISNRP
jgi:purine-cytosine permease-like protein